MKTQHRNACKKFDARGIIVFGGIVFKKPAHINVDYRLQLAKAHDFLYILGCINYMHWESKNCPMGCKAVFTNRTYKSEL